MNGASLANPYLPGIVNVADGGNKPNSGFLQPTRPKFDAVSRLDLDLAPSQREESL